MRVRRDGGGDVGPNPIHKAPSDHMTAASLEDAPNKQDFTAAVQAPKGPQECKRAKSMGPIVQPTTAIGLSSSEQCAKALVGPNTHVCCT
jgi:hypothetical protein|mmetsp:Transcript_9095/g.17147  ORF Transcript_9095/g.17147 Transcript_9095/m.17147 type:complete len:90 (-) Transcript_9095:1230-1499(-)